MSINEDGRLICSGIKMRLKELLCKNSASDNFYYSAIFGNKTSYEREGKKVISNSIRSCIFFSSFQRNNIHDILNEYLMEFTSVGKIFLSGSTFMHSLFLSPHRKENG